jgi:HD-GYP domain-containing protein (c-di-GMP phosphodiesterase class II)
LSDGSGTQFSPEVVEAMLRHLDKHAPAQQASAKVKSVVTASPWVV